MHRREFVKLTSALCASPAILRAQQTQSAIVIGAGAAGLTAAFHLKKAGIDVKVLEASDRWGGRTKRLDGFADVPLDLGAEWIHTDPTVLGEILGEGESDLGVKTIAYDPQTHQTWHNNQLKDFNLLRHFYQEVKFYDTTWFGFFERFILPSVQSDIVFNAPVEQIASNGAGVTVTTFNEREFNADKVIVAAPLSLLQQEKIGLSDDLYENRLRDLKDVVFGSGLKAFLTFEQRFYPDVLTFGSRMQAISGSWDSKIYYDAAFKKPTQSNILGLFNVSEAELPWARLSSADLLDAILADLSDIFGEVASQSFIKGATQVWSQEPHIMGSYSMSNNSGDRISDILSPLSGKVFFAGELLGGKNQSTVHGAAFSAISAVDQILQA